MTEDDASEPFRWLDFIELASELAERQDEASLRTAVSRSYYALFHTAQVVLEHLDPDYSVHRSRDSHKQVWDRLGSIGRRQTKSAMNRGRSLLHTRKQADYRLKGSSDWPKTAKDAVARAESAIKVLRDLLPEP